MNTVETVSLDRACNRGSNIFSETAKKDRVVTLRVFENHEYIKNTETAKSNPDKIPEMENLAIDRLELLPITPLEIPSLQTETYEIPSLINPGEVIPITLDANGKVVPPGSTTPLLPLGDNKPLSSKEQKYAEALAKTLVTANSKANDVAGVAATENEHTEIGVVLSF